MEIIKKIKASINKKVMVFRYLQDYRFNSLLVKSFGIILALMVCIFTIVMLTVYKKMKNFIREIRI